MSYAPVPDSVLLEEHLIPFLAVASTTCCIQDAAGGAYDIHHHSWCKGCADAVEYCLYDWEDKARELFQTGCKHCHAVRMVRAVSTKFLEAMDSSLYRPVPDEDIWFVLFP